MSRKFRKKVVLKPVGNKPDIVLLILTFILVVFGVIMVGNVSVVEAYQDFGDKFYYLKLQAQWAALGILGLLGGLFFNFKRLRGFAFPLLLATIFFLIAVLIPGVGIKALGAKRWLGVGPFRFQPSELAKFAFILWAAAFLSNKKKTLPFLGILGLLGGLIILQPDLGTAIILVVSGMIVYFVSGAPIWEIGVLGILGVLAGLGLIFSSPYRKERFLTFLNPSRDPLGASYHIRQILIALGSGGLWGVGLGQSRQKYEYIPMATTDSIFAIIAEEVGFLGAMVLVLLFLVFIWRGLKIAKEAPDEFSRLLAVGITSWIGFQALLNLGAMTALIPLTGIPLPFISYGGSSLVLSLVAVGILANISKYKIVRK
jgi:cell division protein FtsW